MAKIKGTAILPAVKLVRKNRELIEPLLDEAGRRLAAGRILPGSWYPIEDASSLLRAICRFYGGAPEHAMEMVGMYCAEGDLNGVYAHLITPGDPGKSFRRAVMLWRNYQDTGTLHYLQLDPASKKAVLRLEGFVQTIPYCASLIGMARVVARLAGASDTFRIQETRCTLGGDPFCEFESSWD